MVGRGYPAAIVALLALLGSIVLAVVTPISGQQVSPRPAMSPANITNCSTANSLLQGGSPPTCTATPNLGTPSGGTLTNTTGFPVANLAGLGTGVAAALAANTGGAGAFALFGGALGAASATSIALGTPVALSSTQPTFTSGCGGATGRTIAGTAVAFSVVVGSSSTDNNCVFGLPTATNGWVCRGENQTSAGGKDIKQSASTTSAATMTQYDTTLGTAANFASSDVLKISCLGY